MGARYSIRDRGRWMRRQWSLLVLLRGRPRTLHECACLFAVSTRTIRRDLEVLEALHFPIYRIPLDGCSRGDGYYIGELPEWPRRHVAPIAELRSA